jgi:hypothetical protein
MGTIAEVRSAPLPFVLFAFNWGAYFLATLVGLFMEGGISESEEWRIFIVGWLVIPLASLASALLIAYLKRARYVDVESFYPALLVTNALFWMAYFAAGPVPSRWAHAPGKPAGLGRPQASPLRQTQYDRSLLFVAPRRSLYRGQLQRFSD